MTTSTPEEVVKEIDQAFARRDLETVISFYEDSAAVVTEPGHIARGTEELRRFIAHLFALNGEAHQIKTHVIEAGDVALFISRWQFAGTNPDGRRFSRESVATTVLRKDATGKWRIAIDNCFGPAVLDMST